MVTLDVILSLTLVQRSVRKIVNSNLQLVKSSQKTLQDDVLKLLLKRHDPTFQCTKTASHTFHDPNSLSWCLCSQRVLKCLLWQNQQRFKSSTITVMWRNVYWFSRKKITLILIYFKHIDVRSKDSLRCNLLIRDQCWKNIFKLLMNHKILSKADKVFTPQLDK